MKKKTLLFLSLMVIMVSIFVSCSVHKDTSTTAVTDNSGTTHYYEVVTDDSDTTVLREIATDSNDKSITERNGKYVTIKDSSKIHTDTNSVTDSVSKNTKSTTVYKNNGDDNDVPFESTTENKITDTPQVEPEPTSQPTTTTMQAATDADGWITKWY